MSEQFYEIIALEANETNKRISAIQNIKDPEILEYLVVSDISDIIQAFAYDQLIKLKEEEKVNEIKNYFLNTYIHKDNKKVIDEFKRRTGKKYLNLEYFDEDKANRTYKRDKQLLRKLDNNLKRTIYFQEELTGRKEYRSFSVGYRRMTPTYYEKIVIFRYLEEFFDTLIYRFSLFTYMSPKS